MRELEFKLPNHLGMHARAAAKFSFIMERFKSRVFLKRNHQRVNAKEIMALMMIAASQGTSVTLTAEGPDEDLVILDVKKLLENNFFEGRGNSIEEEAKLFINAYPPLYGKNDKLDEIRDRLTLN